MNKTYLFYLINYYSILKLYCLLLEKKYIKSYYKSNKTYMFYNILGAEINNGNQIYFIFKFFYL